MKSCWKKNIFKKDVPDPFLVYQIYHSCCLTSGFDVQWQDYLRKMIISDMVSCIFLAQKLSSAQMKTVTHSTPHAKLKRKPESKCQAGE